MLKLGCISGFGLLTLILKKKYIQMSDGSTLIPSDPTLFSFRSNRFFFSFQLSMSNPRIPWEKSWGKYVLTVDQKERTTFERV